MTKDSSVLLSLVNELRVRIPCAYDVQSSIRHSSSMARTFIILWQDKRR